MENRIESMVKKILAKEFNKTVDVQELKQQIKLLKQQLNNTKNNRKYSRRQQNGVDETQKLNIKVENAQKNILDFVSLHQNKEDDMLKSRIEKVENQI